MARIYDLHTPKDDHGQPIRLFKANAENNVSKAIDRLSGICEGILADGVVNDQEARFFQEWLQGILPFEPVWPFTDIIARVEKVFADGRIDEAEREDLASIMRMITGTGHDEDPSETHSSGLPLDVPQPENVEFTGRLFVPTGRFALGTRKKVLEAIGIRGGLTKNGFPTRETDYLVIGVFASRDWYNTNYGRKIERAVELRGDGKGISIISEETLTKAL